jgi:hypothetical protein
MEINIKSTKKTAKSLVSSKPIYSTLYCIEVTNANILDYNQFQTLFSANDFGTSEWEETMMENDVHCFFQVRNVTGNSFNMEVEDFDGMKIDFGDESGDMRALIKYYLNKYNLKYTEL